MMTTTSPLRARITSAETQTEQLASNAHGPGQFHFISGSHFALLLLTLLLTNTLVVEVGSIQHSQHCSFLLLLFLLLAAAVVSTATVIVPVNNNDLA